MNPRGFSCKWHLYNVMIYEISCDCVLSFIFSVKKKKKNILRPRTKEEIRFHKNLIYKFIISLFRSSDPTFVLRSTSCHLVCICSVEHPISIRFLDLWCHHCTYNCFDYLQKFRKGMKLIFE